MTAAIFVYRFSFSIQSKFSFNVNGNDYKNNRRIQISEYKKKETENYS